MKTKVRWLESKVYPEYANGYTYPPHRLTLIIGDALEQRLAVMLLRFEDVLERAAEDAAPNQITTYLYDLVTLFMRFYEQNPMLKEGVDETTKMSRLQLADLTAKTIKQGLDILGIQVVNKL